MTYPLSPEAVAQAPEWPAHEDCKVECWFSPTLRTLAAENATLRASEAAALERIAELEAAACSYQAALLRQGIDGSKGPKE